eukprot:1178172-Prorocentrum_minimum.AAC.1
MADVAAFAAAPARSDHCTTSARSASTCHPRCPPPLSFTLHPLTPRRTQIDPAPHSNRPHAALKQTPRRTQTDPAPHSNSSCVNHTDRTTGAACSKCRRRRPPRWPIHFQRPNPKSNPKP